MNERKNYYEFDLLDYNCNYYTFQGGIYYDTKRQKIMIPEELMSQMNPIKENNNSENINQATGLVNFGHSCSINALLQCLINCVPLTKYFLTEYHKDNNKSLSDLYQGFIKKYQQKDVYAAQKIINYFLNSNSSIKNEGGDSKDILFEFFDKIQSELKQSEISIIIDESTSPENEKDVIDERIKLDNADYSIISKCFNFWIKNEQKCLCNRCPEFGKTLYEIRSETYFVFYLSEIYSKKYYSGRGNGFYNKLSLEECFYYYFIEKGKCNYCRRNLEIKNKICKLPNILIIVLNRGKNNNCNVDIEFNQELNLDRYYQKLRYSNKLNLDGCPKYHLLCGTILEKYYLNPGKGHTIAFATDYNGKYNIYDDEKIKYKEDFQNIKNKDVYILFYQMKNKSK